jgi:hypothetical protein
MSLLPQRKKSADEIAKLRETFGIPGQVLGEEASPPPDANGDPKPEIPVEQRPVTASVPKPDLPKAAAPKANPESPVGLSADPNGSLPAAPAQAPRPVRSLKRSERTPTIPGEEPAPAQPTAPATHLSTAAVPQQKLVHSLRKSELVPITPAEIHTPPPGSILPVHRHSDQELNELRRKAAITAQAPAVYYAKIRAHLALLIPGYLSAVAGGICFYCYELSIGITAGCVAVALLLASFIFVKKPLSRHHAAFISVIALFVIVFGALHYFPQLRHGT